MLAFVVFLLVSIALVSANLRVVLANDQSSPDASNTTDQYELGKIPPSETLVWYPCETSYVCANLTVPLEYSLNASGPVSYAALIKLPAQSNSTDGPYQGMILTNPGGPGLSGIDSLLLYGKSSMVPAIGTNYDIISWDPRGIGYSIPSATCATSILSSTNLRKRFLDLPDFPQSYWDDEIALIKQVGQQCQDEIGGEDGAGPHMTTAVVARDMLTITDAFQNATCANGTLIGSNVPCSEPALVNYWGFSYGTYLGHTFASMYPDRVGKFMLDGVVDPEDWSSGLWLKTTYLVNDVVGAFFQNCSSAGPSNCSFATEGSSAESLETRFNAIASHLNATEAYAQQWSNASFIEAALYTFKNVTLTSTYYPLHFFPSLSVQLVAFESALANGNLTENTLTAIASMAHLLSSTMSASWGPAVYCTDTDISVYNYTLEDFRSYFAELKSESELSWEIRGTLRLMCVGWSITPNLRYSGPFGGETKKPMLFVSNTVDPLTPITNSETWAPRYVGAQVLTIQGIGHTSVAVPNHCTWGNIKAYFQNNTLPGNDAYCPSEVVPFATEQSF